MNRVDRIKLYKKIYNKYIKFGISAHNLPKDEIDEAIKSGFLLSKLFHPIT